MTEQNTFAVPPELITKWGTEAFFNGYHNSEDNWKYENYIAHKAALWGAKQQLEICSKWLLDEQWFAPDGEAITEFRSGCSPRTISLKEQALEIMSKPEWSMEEEDIIRQALESIPDN
jgi:hypothetical protein